MTVEGVFLWLYWACYWGMWYFHWVDQDGEQPFHVRVLILAAYGAGILGMLFYLTGMGVRAAAPIGWLLFVVVVTASLANDIRWYRVIVRKSYPVPPAVKRVGAVLGCTVDFALQVPCMVMLYRFARGMVPP